ncbi:S66 peptidase family protein [Brevibacillus invocatus]|uniref:S66 peptidase family protein n=1 Tax=Brevibacillus invocatus TaxID=173959 RepID=UPI00203D5638|nr:LD-carboxypeptidase [Brevibacillus invocatus]MCM3079374.1 LD-carboxypeptidase [Brevibacillus invocatus]MCM3429574.1 LD-carboxypeptidase [Brevibacillus invocatus]
MNKGRAWQAGDTIGIVAPSSPGDLELLPKAIAKVEELGFKVKVGETCRQTYGGYLAGTPQLRAAELNAMFADDQVDGILCLRGGYGAPQILPLLDYDCIAQNPKLFVGYSDITALHTVFGQDANLATLHGPMASSCLARGLDDWSMSYLLRALTEPEPLGEMINPPEEEVICMVDGQASGPIVGGNLALVAALMGTPYELDTRGKLLFLEDIDEEPYRIDRMLTQLALGGLFDDCAGVILGTWTNCEPKKREGFSVWDVFQNIVVPYQKPMIWNIQIGHGAINMALPFGVHATLDATSGVLTIEESVTV